MKTSDFDYHLPPELIAQVPVEPRDQSRLLVLDRSTASTEHRYFSDIVDYLDCGDTVVLNDTRVIPARISGQKGENGDQIEILLLRRSDDDVWDTLVRPARKAVPGTRIAITGEVDSGTVRIEAEVLESRPEGVRVIRFSNDSSLRRLGQVPLPPYIRTPLAEPERYQTVYAKMDGSVAAPTAGLHFTPRLLDVLQHRGVQLGFVTLHIGLDTFRPVRVSDPTEHPIHREYGALSPEVAALLNETRSRGKRIVAVGTSTVRLVEAAAQTGVVEPVTGWVDLFILPGHRFQATDVMVTNFHLPRSTLLMLVSAFAGTERILRAYEEAKSHGYGFYSFGDAMLVL